MDIAKEELIKKLEREADRIHNSTRTDISFLSPVHNYLRSRSRMYYSWSVNRTAQAVHIAAILAFVISIVIFALISQIIS